MTMDFLFNGGSHEEDPEWVNSDEGKACARLAREESQRLKEIMVMQKYLRDNPMPKKVAP